MNSSSAAPRVYPPLFRDRSFWGMVTTQFLGAFNDNFYKQMVVFVCLEIAAVDRARNPQWIAMILFAAPFVLLSGYCGYLSDRQSKQRIVVLAKVLEIVVMGLGLAAFWLNNLPAMLGVLFLMSAQSALFGPSKYGILPELFDDKDLPQANGVMLMTTFLAIILALPAAGYARDLFGAELWKGAVIAVVIAVVGTLTSLLVRWTPVARPNLKFEWSSLWVDLPTRQLLRENRKLLLVLLATSIFWTTGGVLYPNAINDLGKLQFQLSDFQTGQLAACTGVGIIIGCVLGGILSHRRFNGKLVRFGSWGMVAGLILIGLPGRNPQINLLGIRGTAVTLVWLGMCAGLFSVPLQVYLQSKSPLEFKGRIIGTMNLANWIGICSAGAYYGVLNALFASMSRDGREIPHSAMFFAAAALVIPLAVLFRPQSESLQDEADSASGTESGG